MHISLLGATVSLLCVSATAFTPASTSGTDKLNDHGMTKLKTYLHKYRGENTCSLNTAVKRQEWYARTVLVQSWAYVDNIPQEHSLELQQEKVHQRCSMSPIETSKERQHRSWCKITL
jgi:hypothetical protein